MKAPEIQTKRKVLLFAFFMLLISVLSIIWIQFLENWSCQSFVTINGLQFYVEIADNPEERSTGLSNRNTLGQEEGMFFVYLEEDYRSFWMKDTLIPLDIIFIDDSYHIVNIIENAKPCPPTNCPQQYSVKKAKYVLEINGGLSEKYGFKMGNTVEFQDVKETKE